MPLPKKLLFLSENLETFSEFYDTNRMYIPCQLNIYECIRLREDGGCRFGENVIMSLFGLGLGYMFDNKNCLNTHLN